jgi:putative nucleotidyltransferase with HDIG domain
MFGRLFGKGSATKKKVCGLSPAISDEIRKFLGPRGLPVMPQAAQRAFELSVKPAADARAFVEVIESDESLSSRVIKIANSAFFDRGKKSSTVEEAVIVIGLAELRALLSAATLAELFPSTHPSRKILWEHDIAVALYARTIAERVAPEISGVAFMGGLMHDIGKLLLLQRDSELFSELLKISADQEISSVEAEEQKLLFSHCDIGMFIAERWNFSEELKRIIANHHRGDTNDIAAEIVKCADALVHLSPPYSVGEQSALRKHLIKKEIDPFQALSVPVQEHREIEARCRKTFEKERDIYVKAP